MSEPMPDEETLPKVVKDTEFKKPVLIGRIGKLPRKAKTETQIVQEKNYNIEAAPPIINEFTDSSNPDISLQPAVKEISTPIPYKEPKWSGLCPDGTDYALEVLKSGTIVGRKELTNKPFYIFGRLSNCDVVMAHPTISRHHAVLQYKAFSEEGEPSMGWYLYDLGSTHGTFLNKDQLKANHYTRVRVGHQLKFGNSTRTYIVLGPDFDCEGESELTVTEIKQKAAEMKKERDRFIQEVKDQREKDKLEEEKKRAEQGIDWGMGEDAEEEPDLADNPFASTVNEELYLEDPKKTLRGYFEREGLELKYDCDERGVGQFLCRVELPIDDAKGLPVWAEVLHKGKKKEAVIACALESCRILDRAGLLRQAKHESRRRKQRDWSADDFYDSDDDTFLDRTGTVERKRKHRMNKHGGREGTEAQDKPLTYDDLVKQISDIEAKISSEEKCLERLRSSGKPKAMDNNDVDALDQFMTTLKQGHSMAEKAEISKTKMSIQKLKIDLAKTQRLAELARPANIPALIKKDESKSKMAVKVGSNSVIYGKRIRLKDDETNKRKINLNPQVKVQNESEFVEEVDSDEEMDDKTLTTNKEETKTAHEDLDSKSNDNVKKVYGPMRPPDNYVVPENYFDQESDRDLPEILEGNENSL